MTSTEGGAPVRGEGAPPARRRHGVPGSRGDAVRAEEFRSAGVLRVTVAGARELDLRRLVRLLDGTEGIEVVGRVTTPPSREGAPTLIVSLHEPLDVVAPAPGRPSAHGIHSVPEVRRPDLSRRQVDVLTAYGRSNALLEVVARGLAMTPETVKTHLRRIRAKYSAVGRPAPTRRDLYVRAIEDGFLPPPG